MKIELIYFDGCPNIGPARDSIRAACEILGVEPEWAEWNQNDSNVPDYVAGYGSPTILVNGKDVDGSKAECCSTGNCRIYPDLSGVPSVDMILGAMKEQI